MYGVRLMALVQYADIGDGLFIPRSVVLNIPAAYYVRMLFGNFDHFAHFSIKCRDRITMQSQR